MHFKLIGKLNPKHLYRKRELKLEGFFLITQTTSTCGSPSWIKTKN